MSWSTNDRHMGLPMVDSGPDTPVVRDESSAEADRPPPLPFVRPLRTCVVHLVALPPIYGRQHGYTTLYT